MANKRITELNELTYNQVSGDDFFLISDVSAVESKKIRASQLRDYAFSTGSLYGSFYGTASYALRSLSASYAPDQISASYAISSSFALLAQSVISASYALSASFASASLFAQRAITASYALTSSVQYSTTSSFANASLTASYLLYTAGFNNGTSSHAMSSSVSRLATTSSYLLYSGIPNGTASYALSASRVTSASYLVYTGANNGTASYALKTGTTVFSSTSSVANSVNNPYIYREFNSFTASVAGNTASFGFFQLTGSHGIPAAIMEAWGDVLVPHTSSMFISGAQVPMGMLELVTQGTSGTFRLDKATFGFFLNASGSSEQNTGSIICTFYLKGKFTSFPDPQRFSGSIYAYNGLTFYTSSRKVQAVIKATTDHFLDE
jgi:hypothetical protein